MSKLTNYTRGRLAYYFKIKLNAFNYKKGWMKATCPFCGKKLKFGINLGLNRTNCFRCGANKTPISLLMFLENLDTTAEFKHFIGQLNEVTTIDVEEHYEIPEKISLNLPEGFNLFGTQDGSETCRIFHRYVEGRGLDLKTLRYLGWGYCNKGELFGYLIIPFFENGQMVYYNARKVIGSGPRYKNPNNDNSGVGKSLLMYNHDALDLYDKVYLCEGAINAVTLGEKAISSGGKFVSKYQHDVILKSNVEKVVIVLDSDAKEKAIETALILCQEKRVKVVFLPDGKDINDLGRKKAIRYIRKAPYLTYNEIIELKHLISKPVKYTY